MELIMDKIKNTKILGIIGNVLVILALFLPTAVIKADILGVKESLQYIKGDGKILLVLSIINLIIIFADKIPLSFLKGFTNVKVTAISTIIEIIILINFSVKGGDALVGNAYIKSSWGIGFYLMWVGVVVSMLCPIIYREKNKEQLENSSKEETK